MGNSQAQNFDPQASGFFTALPEDIMILLADLISVQDFVHLITTCKYYNHQLFGPNNFLWARLCHSLGGANKVLKDLQFYQRWKVNTGQEKLDLNKELDLTDKQLMRSIDFKKEVFNYYLLIVNIRRLRQRILQLTPFKPSNPHLTMAMYPEVTVLPFTFWTNLSQYYTREDLKSNNFAKDYFYVVDLYYDAASVESAIPTKPFVGPIDEKSYLEATTLPSKLKGRLVLYKKSHRKLQSPDFFSRTETILHQEPAIEDLLHDDMNNLEQEAPTFRQMK